MFATRHNRRQTGSVGALLTAVVTVGIALTVLINKQYITDQVAVWQYKPSSQIINFADRSGMSNAGRFYFYASQPSLEGRQVFNSQCANQDTNTAVLGCYVGQKIYIYDINNPQLIGIRTVTAAHEMLHAAYARLNNTDKTKINQLLEAEYAKIKDDPNLAARMAFYAKTEPGERNNELHSVIATEIPSISPALESYYSKYFTARQKVISLHASYQAVFNNLKLRADQITQQLDALKLTIEQDSSAYNAKASALNSDIKAFNQKASNGDFTSQSQFDRERSLLVAQADQLDNLRATINTNISNYNALLKELESVASQSNALNQSINSKLTPPPNI